MPRYLFLYKTIILFTFFFGLIANILFRNQGYYCDNAYGEIKI